MLPERVQRQITEFLRGLTGRQKAWLLLSAAVVAATLAVFVYFLGRPEYRTISGLSLAEAQALLQKEKGQGVEAEIGPDGALRVPAGQVDKVRMDMAAQGLPQSGRVGFELFDKPNWAGSDFAEKVNYQRALEGELQRTIQTLREVEAVRVHLVLPRESLFTEREREGKASVVLQLRSGKLARESVAAITFLVSSAVDNLKPENVTVVGADGRPMAAHQRPGAWYGQSEMETHLAEKLVATLAPVAGVDRVRASVAVEYDPASTENTQETYDPNRTVLVSSQKSEDRSGPGAGETATGIPGTASNVPGTPSPALPGKAAGPASAPAPGDAGPYQRTQSETYAVSKSVRHSVQPPGSLKRVAAAVLIDDGVETVQENGQSVEKRRKRAPEEMKQMEGLARAALGLDASRGDTLVMENLAFQSLPVETPPPPTWLEQVRPLADRFSAVLRYGTLALLFLGVYWLVLRPIKNQVLVSLEPVAGQVAGGRPQAVLAGGPSPESQSMSDILQMEAEMQRELSETNSEIKKAVMLKRHLVDKVKKDAAGASRLIQNWIREKEERG